ncbi:MAG: hypothetical protein IJJ33_19605 [Victivallales bacterium]|nr:hypothetical protein [Victivallales bacterium]
MQKLGLWAVVAAIVLVLGVSVYFGSRPLPQEEMAASVPSRTASKEHARKSSEGSAAAAENKEAESLAGERKGEADEPAVVDQNDPSFKNIRKLQDLMDEVEKNTDAAFEQAKSMLTGKLNDRIFAVNALEWIGGTRSVVALSTALNDSNPDLASLARRAIEHILAKAQYSDDPADQISMEAWDAIVNSDPSEDQKFVYFQKMLELPSLEAVPLLARYLDSSDESTRSLALEYIRMAAHGEEITTQEQATQWVKEEEQRQKAESEDANKELVILPDDTVIEKSIPNQNSQKKNNAEKNTTE